MNTILRTTFNLRSLTLDSALVCVGMTLLSLLPYLLNYPDYQLIIHDNLDAPVTWFKILWPSEFASYEFGYMKDVMLDSVPSNIMNNWLKLHALLFSLFEPNTAFMLNLTAHKLIAIVSFFLLARDYIFPKGQLALMVIGVLSLTYSLLPTYSIYGAGNLSALLLMLWAALKYLDTKAPWLAIIFFLIPFTTALVFFDIWALPITLLLIIFWRPLSWRELVPLSWLFGAFTVGAVLSNLNLFLAVIQPTSGFISHRAEFVKEKFEFVDAVLRSLKYFFYGFYHAPAAPKYLACCVIAYVIFNFITKRTGRINLMLSRILILQALLAILYGFWFWEGMSSVKTWIPFLNSLDATRLSFMSQPVWYIAFAVVLGDIFRWPNELPKYALIGALILLQLTYCFFNNREIDANVRRLAGAAPPRGFSSINDFYIPDVYNALKADFPEVQNGWTITIGAHPAVTRYNDIKVLDFYFVSYDIRYKKQFEQIIAAELSKDDAMSAYFRNYGSRCYAFSAQLYPELSPEKSDSLHLSYNWSAFKEMGGQHIISFYPIANNEVQLLKSYPMIGNTNYNRIFLYRTNL